MEAIVLEMVISCTAQSVVTGRLRMTRQDDLYLLQSYTARSV